MRNKYKHENLLPRLHILGIELCRIRWKNPIERTFEKSSKVQGADNPWVSKPNPISLPKVIDKTYLHLMLEPIANESSKAKSEIWPDTRHKKLMDLVKTLRL